MHPDRQVLLLGIGRIDIAGVGIAFDPDLVHSDAFCWGFALLRLSGAEL
jgi:hypothetical protein